MSPEGREFAHSLKLAAIAVVSAVVTATLVIGVGEAWLRRAPVVSPSEAAPTLIETGG